MEQHLSPAEAASLLRLDRASVGRLIDAGVLGEPITTSRSRLVVRSAAEGLAPHGWVVPPHPAALQVRIQPARPLVGEERIADGEWRDWVGWKQDADPARRRDGWRGRWRPPAHEVEGGLAVATIAGIVVDVATITEIEPDPTWDGYIRFRLEDPDTKDAAPFLGHRFPTERGRGAMRYLPAEAYRHLHPDLEATLDGLHRAVEDVDGLVALALERGATRAQIGNLTGFTSQQIRRRWS